MPFPTLGDLPDPGIKPRSLTSAALAGRFFITSTTWEAPSQGNCTTLIAQLVKNPPVMQETPVRFLGGKDPLEKGRLPTPVSLGFPVAQLVKNPPTMWETWVQSLGWEDPLEKGKAKLSSILAWRIPWTIGHGVAKSRT